MKPRTIRLSAIWAALILLGGAYMAFGVDALINSQLFYPERTLAARPDQLGMAYEDQWIEAADGVKLHAWWIPAPRPKAVLLFFHGNAGNISHRLDNLRLLHGLGLSTLILDYRGYGQSQGSPDERGFYLDAAAAYLAARGRAAKAGLRLVVFGRSLGGAAAVAVGGLEGVSGVILESTFTNLGDMARAVFHLPGLDKAFRSRFDSEMRIPAITAPLLFFHGDRDDIVPHELGRRLFDSAGGPKEFITLKGAGHNDTIMMGGQDYLNKIASFVDNLPMPAGADDSLR